MSKKKRNKKAAYNRHIMDEAMRFVSMVDDDPEDASCVEEKAAILSAKYEAARSDLEYLRDKRVRLDEKIEKKAKRCDNLLAQLTAVVDSAKSKVDFYRDNGHLSGSTTGSEEATEHVLDFAGVISDTLGLTNETAEDADTHET